MTDSVSSSLAGTNDYQKGGPPDVPLSSAFPGNGAPAESGLSTGGQAWQDWQGGDDLTDDEPVTSGVTGSGHVSGGIRVTRGIDAFPGARPPGTQGAISSSTPGWFVDRQSAPTDYDVGPDEALSSPSRPWQSGPRPSDRGTTAAFYPEQSGQIPSPPAGTTGETGPRRLRRDDSAGGTLP
jgi:hypothetical protein